VKRALPLLAAVAAIGLVVLLVGTGDRPTPPAPEPDVTTSTTRPPLRQFAVVALSPGGKNVYDSYELSTVRDLELGHDVTLLHPKRRDLPGAALYDDRLHPVPGQWRLTVRLRVVGAGRANLLLEAMTEVVPGRDPTLARVGTPDADRVQAGRWEERILDLTVPAGAVQLVYFIALEGPGDLYVDDARLATVIP
jgi:hypothetical protein